MANSNVFTAVVSGVTGGCLALAMSAYMGRAETPLQAQAAAPKAGTLTGVMPTTWMIRPAVANVIRTFMPPPAPARGSA